MMLIYKYFSSLFQSHKFHCFFYLSQKMNSKNLPKACSVKKRPDLPLVTVSLSDLCKMPTKKQIVDRYLELLVSEKSRIIRIKMIAEELTFLWKFLNFPILSHQRVQSKTRSFVDLYEKHRKRKSDQVEKELKGLFDITKVDGNWLYSEDKKLYTTQTQTSSWVQRQKKSSFEFNLSFKTKVHSKSTKYLWLSFNSFKL